MLWYVKAGSIILMNLFNLIWFRQIRFERTINRRRPWKRNLVKLHFFILSPLAFVLFLLRLEYDYFLLMLIGLIGIWFSISHLRFMRKHGGVPQLVEPICTMYLMLSVIIILLAAGSIV